MFFETKKVIITLLLKRVCMYMAFKIDMFVTYSSSTNIFKICWVGTRFFISCDIYYSLNLVNMRYEKDDVN